MSCSWWFLSLVVLVSANSSVRLSVNHAAGGGVLRYVGAVLEYEPYNLWTKEAGAEGILMTNARTIAEFAAQAKLQGAQILVAPEYGLTSLNQHKNVSEEFFNLTQYVPDPALELVPCAVSSNPNNFMAMQVLSCAALQHSIYLVVDVAEVRACTPVTHLSTPFPNTPLDAPPTCPTSGFIFHNTQVVFGPSGVVLARYRKKNLFLEPQYVAGTEDDNTAVFTTDFGVTFTLQVCFDMAYFHPGVNNVVKLGIHDVIMSTAWVDTLPFNQAPSAQNAWSRGLGVNLLVSGYHLPERSKLGSGIYRGYSDLAHNYTYDTESGNQLIVMEVFTATVGKFQKSDRELVGFPGRKSNPVSKNASPNLSSRNDPSLESRFNKENEYSPVKESENASVKESNRNHLLYHDDLSNYTRHTLLPGEPGQELSASVCSIDGLCCNVQYSLASNVTYLLVAYSGPVIEGFGQYKIYAQICGVLWCQTEDIETCGRVEDGLPESDQFDQIRLQGNFSTPYIFPAVSYRSLQVADNELYALSVSESTWRLDTTTASLGNVYSFSMYGRWYERDP